jgi:transposase-like protein
VALEAVKRYRTVSELAAKYSLHPTMIHQWRKALLEGASDIFERGGKKKAEVDEETMDDAVAARQDRRVGRRQRSFVTKAQALDRQMGRGMIERSHSTLSIGAQYHSASHQPSSVARVQAIARMLSVIAGNFLQGASATAKNAPAVISREVEPSNVPPNVPATLTGRSRSPRKEPCS